MTVETSLQRKVATRGDHPVHRVIQTCDVATAGYVMNASGTSVSASFTRSTWRSKKHENDRTCVRRDSTKMNSSLREGLFGPQITVAPHRESSRNLCAKPYLLVTWDTTSVAEEEHRMLRNKSHSRHGSASIFTWDHGYTAVSIGDRLIDKAFVYCKNLGCKG
jgi:hypothetical protein